MKLKARMTDFIVDKGYAGKASDVRYANFSEHVSWGYTDDVDSIVGRATVVDGVVTVDILPTVNTNHPVFKTKTPAIVPTLYDGGTGTIHVNNVRVLHPIPGEEAYTTIVDQGDREPSVPGSSLVAPIKPCITSSQNHDWLPVKNSENGDEYSCPLCSQRIYWIKARQKWVKSIF